jgi:hypothetical protein
MQPNQPCAKGAKMKIYRSWLGAILAALYLLAAVLIAYDAYRCSGGSFPLSCDFLLAFIIFPVMPLLALLDLIGVAEPHLRSPGPYASDLLMVTLYIMICAALIYLLGYSIERLLRQIFKK